ncbi:MAG: hypothetical protein C0521_11210 [Xanthomonas sp.]|uniref:hypothetical protein n=1 Tax=Pseudoxanthomonas mexicana TaxID=128785 RepID=UPI000783F535|nr:hypothetical protein [Pseudoxanthomonas mexicana]MBA3930141.1 hypothetical protein [Xanthomonas sp.]MBL8257153.1 hypothetical protein [Pseudoxanthomonas mexicana]
MAFFEVLERVRRRPDMHLKPAGFVTLCAFIEGYESALIDHGIRDDHDVLFLMHFSDFVRTSTGHEDERDSLTTPEGILDIGQLHWQAAITRTEQDDGEAMVLFFDLLDRFKASRSLR